MSSGKEKTKKYRERLREKKETYAVRLKRKTEEGGKKDYLKQKATWLGVLRAKERENKRKQQRNKTEITRK